MSTERTALLTRIYTVAERLNIDKKLTDNIIRAYLQSCKDEILRGYTVNFCGLALIVPDVQSNDCKMTLAFRCRNIARSNAFSYYTVLQVVKEYMKTIEEDIFQARSANIYGLVTLRPLKQNGVVTRVHSTLSHRLQDYLCENGNHARVHTNKSFKRRVKEAKIHDG